MKEISKKFFPAIAFTVAVMGALITTKAEDYPPPTVLVSIYSPGEEPSCIVVGTCEQGGTTICTDVYGNQLHRYNAASETCLPYLLGSFFEGDE